MSWVYEDYWDVVLLSGSLQLVSLGTYVGTDIILVWPECDMCHQHRCKIKYNTSSHVCHD